MSQQITKPEETNFSKMAENWTSSHVARDEIARFTGGIITPKTIANIDSAGTGPIRIKVGGKIAYPVAEFISWLEARATKLN